MSTVSSRCSIPSIGIGSSSMFEVARAERDHFTKEVLFSASVVTLSPQRVTPTLVGIQREMHPLFPFPVIKSPSFRP
jgi:hypothetical protein